MRTSRHLQLVLGAVGTAGLVLAACTSAASPVPQGVQEKEQAAQSAAMDKKDEAMVATTEKKEGAMEPVMMEKKDGPSDAAMIDKKDAMGPAMTDKMEEAMVPGVMDKKESDTPAAAMDKEEGMDAAMMEKKDPATEAAMTDKKEGPGGPPTAADAGAAAQTQVGAMPRKLPDQRLSPHFVISSPKHGETLAQAPERIQINFDFTLHESSAIAVTRNDAPVQIGAIPVNPRGLVLAATLPDAGEGLYVVGYKACWPDRSCHDGQFAFTVGN